MEPILSGFRNTLKMFYHTHICSIRSAPGLCCPLIGRQKGCCKVIGGQLGIAHATHAGTEQEGHIWSCAPVGGAALTGR
ncbi:hypothetical protein DPX16_2721 [Anabarilius grahami]|uniref:Uncharacterized protein n=1 Tax=Anabarilius grahami TaxID=495550 RepID=A0A3N0XGM7_ANAGA|nr:hypothetical protein DPX16_2721 [Anabarilius grahami]